MVARILTDQNGLATGVQYFDRQTGAERQVRAKVVVLGASCVDSTRILLNSKSTRNPNGLGNGSDVIGRYLCEQIRLNVAGYLPALAGTPTRNDRGIGGEHIYMPRFNHRPGRGRDYLRGFGAQFWNTGASVSGAHAGSTQIPGFGAELKKEIKRRHPAWFEIHPFGEVLPYAHNRITVDPARADEYGVPLPIIDYRIGENERKMTEHMADTVEEIVKAAGGVLVNYQRGAARRDGVGDSRARHVPHGRGPEALGAQRVQPDARSEERLRRRRIGVSERGGEEPDARRSSRSRGARPIVAEEIKRGNL